MSWRTRLWRWLEPQEVSERFAYGELARSPPKQTSGFGPRAEEETHNMPIDNAIRAEARKQAEVVFRELLIRASSALGDLDRWLQGRPFGDREVVIDQAFAMARRRVLTAYAPMTYTEMVPEPLVDVFVEKIEQALAKLGAAR